MESFGEKLKREREQRKISLDEVSVATKIGTRFLRALEENRFDQLPGGIFNKGFIRAYARHLGMNEEQAVADYLEATGENKPKEVAPNTTNEEPFPLHVPEEKPRGEAAAQVPWGFLAILLLVVAIGFAAWGFYSRNPKAEPTVVAAPTTTTTKTTVRPPVPDSAMKMTAPSPPNSDIADKSKVIAASQRSVSPVPPAAGTLDTSQALPSASGAFTVQITAREDCWITVTADGQQVLQDTLIAPFQKSVEARKEIVIRAGNMGALNLSFNGKPVPAQGDYGEVKTLTFDHNGLQPTAVRPPG